MERALLGFLLLATCWTPLPICAGELSILVNGHARHLEKSPKDKNELNYGAGLQYDFTPSDDWVWFAFGSAFEDSRKDPSLNLGGGASRRFLLAPTALHVDLGIAGMLMTRESYNNGNPFPAALPVASVGAGPLALNVAYVPELDPRIIPLLFFQIKYTIP